MNKERLLDVAARLKLVPAEKFDISFWFGADRCGTVCCVLGWCCTWYPKDWKAKVSDPEDINYRNVLLYPKLTEGAAYGIFAASEYFDIIYRDARALFMDTDYPPNVGPVEVAEAIERYVETGALPVNYTEETDEPDEYRTTS